MRSLRSLLFLSLLTLSQSVSAHGLNEVCEERRYQELQERVDYWWSETTYLRQQLRIAQRVIDANIETIHRLNLELDEKRDLELEMAEELKEHTVMWPYYLAGGLLVVVSVIAFVLGDV